MPEQPDPTDRRQQLAAEIAQIDYALPGSLNIIHTRCGKPTCRCQADPPQLHGPYITWTRKVHGKTITRRLNPEQLERYRPWIENNRRLRELITELESLSTQAAEQNEGWGQN